MEQQYLAVEEEVYTTLSYLLISALNFKSIITVLSHRYLCGICPLAILDGKKYQKMMWIQKLTLKNLLAFTRRDLVVSRRNGCGGCEGTINNSCSFS